MCDSVNHTLFPKEDHLPDWVCRDKHGNKGDRVEQQGRKFYFQGVMNDMKVNYTVYRRSRLQGKGKLFNVLLTVHHAMILGNCPTWRTNFTSNQHTTLPPTRIDNNQKLYWYNLFLLMMSMTCSKHVENYK